MSTINPYPTSNKQMQLIFLWPPSNNNDTKKLTASCFETYNIVVHNTKDIFLNFSEFNQLIYELYQSEPWMIKRDNISLGSLLRKATWCYSKKYPITILVISQLPSETILELKENIRQKISSGKHSLHTIENPLDADFIWKKYLLSPTDFSLAISFKKSIKWNLFKLYYQLRVRLFRLIGYIEQ